MTDAEMNALSALVHAHCVALVGKMQSQDHGYACSGPGYKDQGEGEALYAELVRRGVISGEAEIPTQEDLDVRVIRQLHKKRKQTLANVAVALKMRESEVGEIIERLMASGRILSERRGLFKYFFSA